MATQDIWADALKEAESPEARDAGLWAKCFAEADGDEAKARAAYIKAKVAIANPPAAPATPRSSNRGWCPVCHASIDLDSMYCSACSSSLTARHLSPLRYKPTSPAPNMQQSYSQDRQVIKAAKSRGVYIILALFFGLLGIHNFYAGRFMRGALQFIITAALGWFVIGLVITFIWALIDMFTVTTDGAGDALA